MSGQVRIVPLANCPNEIQEFYKSDKVHKVTDLNGKAFVVQTETNIDRWTKDTGGTWVNLSGRDPTSPPTIVMPEKEPEPIVNEFRLKDYGCALAECYSWLTGAGVLSVETLMEVVYPEDYFDTEEGEYYDGL